MGDTWQYRIRVTGPDRAAWWEKAVSRKWGSGPPMFMWPMLGRFHDGETYQAGGNWYNATTRLVDDYAEFAGNFSSSPAIFFAKEDRFSWRVGPALFDGFDIKVEIVGHSWHADVPGGVYSYRDIYDRGHLVSTECERAEDASVVEKYAPELLVEFPDDRDPDDIEDLDEDEPEGVTHEPVKETHCRHGVPLDDPNCEACAKETRIYLMGLVARPVY